MIDLKRNIEKVYTNKDPFWGKYAELNNATVPSLDAIQAYQMAKIEMFQRAAIQKAEHKNANLNALFTNNSINSLPSAYNKEEEVILGEAITNIVNKLNWTYSYNKSKSSPEYDYQQMQQPLNILQNLIKQLNDTIIANGGQGIPSKYLDTIQQTLNACQIGSLDAGTLESWFSHLNKFKGDLVEDIGVSWLSALKIPNIQTLNTGAVNYQGSSKFGRKGQLIQDLMSLQVSDIDLNSIPIEYKIPTGEVVKTSLKDFISAMESASKQHKQISIYDSGYETLLNLSALNIQAKSGINQLPWNESLSTSVSIGEFAYDDGLSLSAKRTFELLHQLDLDDNPEKDIWVKDSSKDYNYIADYGLATILFKVLHLEENGNNYLLTPMGFTTFTDRIAELMRRKRSRVSIKGGVTINDNTLGTRYNVTMTGYSR